MNKQKRFELLLFGLIKSNSIHIHSKVLQSVTDCMIGAKDETLVNAYTEMLEQICEDLKISTERIIQHEVGR
jgi:hypothetical protein